MIIQSSRKNILIDKDEIINYQFQILEQSTPLAKPTISNSHKYSLWDLDAKIREAVGENKHSVRWIGNSETAYLETYAYIMLIAASHSEANIIQFKHSIYKLGRQCLNLPEQKLLVQFLCLIEYSRDRYAFLNKYPQIQALLIKILQYIQEASPPSEDSAQEIKKKAKVRRKTSGRTLYKSLQKKQPPKNAMHKSKNSDSQQTQYEKELQEIYSGFNKHFQFISLLGSNEYSCSLKLFQTKKICVIIQKECYFMVEIVQKNQKTFLEFTLGNKYLTQNVKDEIHEQIGTQTIQFCQIPYLQCQEIDKILDYQSEVQQSKVIPIQRASQIRSPLKNQFDAKKMEHFHANQHKMSHINAIADRSQNEIDKTFIDELITNPAINSEKDATKIHEIVHQSKLPSHIVVKKQQIMQKMKEFKKMKEAIQQVRERIEEKLKKIDEVQQFKSQITSKIFEKKLSQRTSKSALKKDQQTTQLLSQPVVKFKFDSIANRKGYLNIPTSLQSLPQPKNLEELIMHHKSQHKLPENMSLKNGKFLSQKAHSRPLSKMKIPQESTEKQYKPKIKPILANGKESLDVTLIQPSSPNNVNVNVNVSINENLLNHRFSSPSSTYLKQHRQKYATNKQKNSRSQWVTPNYKRLPNGLNYCHYNAPNQDMNSNVVSPRWNIAKSNNLFNKK